MAVAVFVSFVEGGGGEGFQLVEGGIGGGEVDALVVDIERGEGRNFCDGCRASSSVL